MSISKVLRLCRENPHRNDARLQLASWFESHGDPERGQFIRHQMDSHTIRYGPYDNHFGQVITNREFAKDIDRQADQLLQRNYQRWLGPFPGGFRFDFSGGGVNVSMSPNKNSGGDDITSWFERGMLGIAMRGCRFADRLPSNVEQFFADGWVDRLVLSAGELDLAFIAESPRLANVSWLEVHGLEVDSESVIAFANSPMVANLRELSWEAPIDDTAIRGLANSKRLTQLRRLYLGISCSFGSDGFDALFGSTQLRRLTHLCVEDNYHGNESITSFVNCLRLPNLRHLSLKDNFIDDEGVALLAASPSLSRLSGLNLGINRIGPDGIRHLAASPYVENIEFLDLSGTDCGDAGVIALARSPHFCHLEQLHLDSCGITDEGARELVGAGFSLEAVSISENNISDGILQELHGRFDEVFHGPNEQCKDCNPHRWVQKVKERDASERQQRIKRLNPDRSEGYRLQWECSKSPDRVCHYRSEDGVVELKNGDLAAAPSDHNPDGESEEWCIFCAQPRERK